MGALGASPNTLRASSGLALTSDVDRPDPYSLMSTNDVRDRAALNEHLQHGHDRVTAGSTKAERDCRSETGQPHRAAHPLEWPLKKLNESAGPRLGFHLFNVRDPEKLLACPSEPAAEQSHLEIAASLNN